MQLSEALSLASTEHDETTQAEVCPAALAEAYGSTLYRVAYAVLRNRGEAEDVVQDVFVRVLERRAKLKEVREMRLWLVRIAWNAALDRRRRLRPEQRNDDFLATLAAREQPADMALLDAERLKHVLRELDRLPAREREALILAASGEWSTAEMASVLGRSESAVRALISRARTRLRERLEKGASSR